MSAIKVDELKKRLDSLKSRADRLIINFDELVMLIDEDRISKNCLRRTQEHVSAIAGSADELGSEVTLNLGELRQVGNDAFKLCDELNLYAARIGNLIDAMPEFTQKPLDAHLDGAVFGVSEGESEC